jgi:dipeptidyl aminopeptidase/acylaminoacyl peptidase
MKTLIYFTITLLFSLQSINMTAQQTPLLDRNLFFGNPEISSGQLSPDGKWISFMKEYNGIMNIWVKKFDEPFEKARPLTNSSRPSYGYLWSFDGKYILYVKDTDGDENMNVYAVDPTAKAAKDGVPESRNLTPLKDVTARIYQASQNNFDLMFVGLNDRDKAWHDLYSLKISTGELKKIYENNDRITGYNFDWDDKLRVLERTDEKGNTVMLRIDAGNKLTPIYETSVTEQAGISGWNEDNSQFYLVTNKGDLNFMNLFLMNPQTQKLTKIESDPLNKVDFGNLSLDNNTRKIISTSYTDDKTRIYWKDKTWEKNYEFLKKKFPGREVTFQSSTRDYKKFLIATYGDKYAAEAYFFYPEKNELIFQYTPRPELKKVEQHLSAMTPVTYKSSDGMEIPAYLTIPQGKEAKNLPVVILVHGGPKGPRDNWGYDPQVQFLANRGYAVLQPNFRASGGYGKQFLNAGDLQWGKLMQDDITWGVKYLIEKGIADKNKVAIMGGSYGGYATLAGLAFTPDLYACGVDIVGPSNLFTLLESIPAYWEAGRAFLHGMLGDPNTEEGKKRIEEASPLFSVSKINKPLMIIQGANDPRVKKAESDQIVIALRDKGKPVTYLLAEDEGHGFAKPVNRMAMYAETEKFLASVLGGRFQPDMPEEVSKRLAEITVDIKGVTYAPKVALVNAATLPAIKNTLKPETYNYDVLIEVQGQRIPMAMTRTVSKIDNNWLVREETKGPLGNINDEIEYTDAFVPVNRNMEQMGQQMSVSYSDKKVALTAMGNTAEMTYGGAFISDGPGMDQFIAGLPLKAEYELVFDMPNMASMATKQTVLKVVGEESYNGNICWKVNITATENENDKTTLWINKNTNVADRIESIVPAMGNAKMTYTIK